MRPLAGVGFSLLLAFSALVGAADKPLPSWQGASRQAVMEFVKRATTQGSADFISPADRVAVFDNDGTLWTEQPLYFQAFFALDRLQKLAPEHPQWQSTEPYASMLQGKLSDALKADEHGVLKVIAEMHAGMTATEFSGEVAQWLATAKHPVTGRLYTDMVYQPMLELLVYLRQNHFKTYIVSGGGIDFLRVFSQQVYGIPPEQVVGSSLKAKYVVQDGVPQIVKLAELNFIDDKEGKPVGIHQHIGKRPVFAAGNSDGDFQMLEWTTSGEGLRFGLLVHHDDKKREYAYDRDSSIGTLARGLDEAQQRGWSVVSMKKEWKTIYPSN